MIKYTHPAVKDNIGERDLKGRSLCLLLFYPYLFTICCSALPGYEIHGIPVRSFHGLIKAVIGIDEDRIGHGHDSVSHTLRKVAETFYHTQHRKGIGWITVRVLPASCGDLSVFTGSPSP